MPLAITVKQLFAPTVLTTSAATLFTCPSSPSTSVLVNGRVRCTNTTASIQSVTLYAVPNAGAASAGNCFANAETLPPNGHLDFDIPVLAAGDFLQALAGNATAVTISALAGTVMAQ